MRLDRLGFVLSVLIASGIGWAIFEVVGPWFLLVPFAMLLLDFGASLHRKPEMLRPLGGITELPTEREIWAGARFWIVVLSTVVGAIALSKLLRAAGSGLA
ncbi:MAG: hypothetical protein QNJ20_08170 [Paracoccaceae bacterium]|nr:hypothetical protein [Paracoccaceae bacterium]